MNSSSLILATALLTLGATQLSAQSASVRRDYPSCDLAQQHRVRGQTGGAIRDIRQAHISMRANILEADISNARKARRLSQPQAQKLWQRVELVRRDTNRAVAKQGFLSAGEVASYDRALDMVATAICR
ncbi:hypothetical protein KV697_10345 [Sphingomonas sanguinis]|uniref:hypothetical protein n=1 Tax=Sphingomonas sanguinis TaxID=33051 RepID=UPI001C5856B4|nr:hypothetical protein [Sphingomonas sanguinis]QXT34239.1 hypothetical protein KV697_10345 [Sphingomonas sanguinis]